MATPADSRPLIIFHHLGGSRGHASRCRMCFNAIGVRVGGAVVVIGLALVPLGLYQGFNNRLALGRLVDRNAIVGLQVSNLTAYLIHPVLHCRRQRADREIALAAVTQHLGQAVVTSHDDKAVALAAVIDIKTSALGRIGQTGCHGAGRRHETGRLLSKKPVCHLTGLGFAYLSGQQTENGSQGEI